MQSAKVFLITSLHHCYHENYLEKFAINKYKTIIEWITTNRTDSHNQNFIRNKIP